MQPPNRQSQNTSPRANWMHYRTEDGALRYQHRLHKDFELRRIHMRVGASPVLRPVWALTHNGRRLYEVQAHSRIEAEMDAAEAFIREVRG